MKDVFIAWFGAIVIFIIAARGLLDLAASIEYAQEIFPWLRTLTQSKRGYRLLLSLTCLFYGGTLYELLKEAPPFVPPIPTPGALSIVAVAQENRDLSARLAELTKPAPLNSLRQRTIGIVNELNLFWAKMPAQPVQNPASEADRARDAQYWQEIKVAYRGKEFNERILGIVREYQTKGVPVGYLERSAEQPDRYIGALLYGGSSLDACDQYMSELCLLRELAFHVDAYDVRIDSAKF